jgi:hypothetical protein
MSGPKQPPTLNVPAVAVQASTFANPELFAKLMGFLFNNGLAGLAVVNVIDGGADGFGLAPLGLADDEDNVAPIDQGRYLGTVARLTGYDATGNNWDRLRTAADNGDAQAALALGVLATLARNEAFNGATWDRLRTNAAAVLSATTQPFAQLAANPGEWSVSNEGAAGARATVTRAAGAAGVRHVCRSLAFSVSAAAAAQTVVNARVRDGATGAGTILWSATFVVLNGDSKQIALSGLNILGSAATAMTFEFDVAPVAGNFQTAAGSGYSTV